MEFPTVILATLSQASGRKTAVPLPADRTLLEKSALKSALKSLEIATVMMTCAVVPSLNVMVAVTYDTFSPVHTMGILASM